MFVVLYDRFVCNFLSLRYGLHTFHTSSRSIRLRNSFWFAYFALLYSHHYKRRTRRRARGRCGTRPLLFRSSFLLGGCVSSQGLRPVRGAKFKNSFFVRVARFFYGGDFAGNSGGRTLHTLICEGSFYRRKTASVLPVCPNNRITCRGFIIRRLHGRCTGPTRLPSELLSVTRHF